MSDFEKAFNQLSKVSLENHTELWGEPKTERAFFEVGQASKQAEIDELQKQVNVANECINTLVNERLWYLDKITKAIAHLDSFDLSRVGMNKLQRSIESALEALRGAND